MSTSGSGQALQKAFTDLVWQRCRTEESLGVHFRRDVPNQTPASYRDQMHVVLDRVLKADSQEEPRTRPDDLRGRLEEKTPSTLYGGYPR